MQIEKSGRGSLFGITRLCRVMPNSDPEGRVFLFAPNNHDRFFFLHTFWSPAFDFKVGVAINELCSYTLTSSILKVDVVCDVTMMSTPSILTTELRGLLYNQCIDDVLLFLFCLSQGANKGIKDKICQHWWRSWKTLSDMQEKMICNLRG